MAFEASADERETRGFISMTTRRPSAGLTANCTFEPPVSTPISRSTAIEALRIIWYSLSLSVSAGATVIEFARMHAHRVDVLDRADDDAVVGAVAHHLHLELFPSKDAFLDQHFGGRRGVEAGGDDVVELGAVVGDAAAGAAHGEGGADDRRQADMVERLGGNRHGVADIALLAVALAEVPAGFERVELRVQVGGSGGLQRSALGFVRLAVRILRRGCVGQHRLRRLQPDPGHRLAKQRAVLRLVDGVGVGADHLHAIALEHPHAAQRKRGIQRRLPAHGRQQRVRPLPGDDLGDHFRRDRLDVCGVRQLRIGHDRRRIGIHENDTKTFAFQCLAGLRAGIVELACLTDDDRPGADDQDRLYVGSLGHMFAVRRLSAQEARRNGPAGRQQDSDVRLGGPYREEFSPM